MKTIINNKANPKYLKELYNHLNINLGLEVGNLVYRKSDLRRKKNPLIFLGIELELDMNTTVVSVINDNEHNLVYLRFLEREREIHRVPELSYKEIFRYANKSERVLMELYLQKNSPFKEDPYRISDWTAFPYQVGSGILCFDKVALLGYFTNEYRVFRESTDA